MDVIIYHNPRCGTSRNTLGLIRNAGIEPHIVEYLKTRPARALIRQLAARAGVPLRALLRDKEPVFRELGLNDSNLVPAYVALWLAAGPLLPSSRAAAAGSGGFLPARESLSHSFHAGVL